MNNKGELDEEEAAFRGTDHQGPGRDVSINPNENSILTP